MKILMYADGFGIPTQTFITQDIIYLSKNHEILFVCIIQNKKTNIPNIIVRNIPIQQNPIQKILWKFDLSLTFKNLKFKAEIDQIISSFKPDIIHCQFGIEALRFIDNLSDTSIPLTIQFRGYDASRMLHKKSYVRRLKKIMNRPNYFSIFVSNSLRNNLNSHAINTKRSMILHSGIDLHKFKKEKKRKERDTPFIFLQISSLNEKKGHYYTLHAFAKFLASEKSKTYILKLTGDGPQKIKLEKLALKLNIHNYVEFIGFVSSKKAKLLLEEANVFVHHSITPKNGDEEGIPNAIMEAMSMELPIISTYHAGIPELVSDGIHGYLVKEKDIDTYALRMRDILTWDKLKNNRETIQKKFEIHYHIQKLETFYSKMKQ